MARAAFSPFSRRRPQSTDRVAFAPAKPPQFTDFRQHLRQKFLSAKSGIDGHHQDDVAEVQHLLDKGDGTGRVEHRAGLLTKLANLRQHAIELDRRRWFSLNQQMIGAGLREIAKITLWFDDHQVHVERLCGRAAHRIHDRRTERDVRYEPAVHDVDMNPIGARLIDGADFLAKPPQIGGKNGGRDNDRLHDALGKAELARGKMKRSIALAKPSSS